MMRFPLGPALVLLLLLAGCTQPPAAPPPERARERAMQVTFEALRFDLDLGTVTVLLYPEAAPQTVALMKQLVAEHYYDGREFNRVVPEFVIQLVDKAGGATDDPRHVPLEPKEGYHFTAGAAGIARSADPNSGGPEFFLMDFASSHLDGNYTVWGQAIQGLDVVHRAARVEAVAFSDVPDPLPPELPGPASLAPTDRMALQPATIRTAQLVQVTLPAEQAAMLPLQAAKSVRAGDFRHNLEWPKDIAPGHQTNLTWYLHAYNGTSMPAPADLRIALDGDALAVQGEDPPGIYHLTWSPSRSGTHDATLLRNGTAMATLLVTV